MYIYILSFFIYILSIYIYILDLHLRQNVHTSASIYTYNYINIHLPNGPFLFVHVGGVLGTTSPPRQLTQPI